MEEKSGRSAASGKAPVRPNAKTINANDGIRLLERDMAKLINANGEAGMSRHQTGSSQCCKQLQVRRILYFIFVISGSPFGRPGMDDVSLANMSGPMVRP